MLWLIAAFALAVEPATAPPVPVPRAAAPADGPPLAIPGPGNPPTVGRDPASDARFPRPTEGHRGGSREHTAALRAYQREALYVRTLSEYYVQPGMTTYWGGGRRWGGMGWATSMPSTVYRVEGWAVFEGDNRLDVPTYLDRVGDSTARLDLERRIRTNHTAGVAFTAIGVVGLVGSVVGLVGAESSETVSDYQTWSTVAIAGGATALTCLITGSFPSARARRLQTMPDRTLDRKEVERTVAGYDEKLADGLGLDPEEAFRLEQRAQRPQDP